MKTGIAVRRTVSTPAGWLAGACLAVAIPALLHADDCPSSPNNYGLTRGKIPYNNHWGNPLKTIFTGPHRQGDWHQHTWCDYMFAGDCYNENWRTNTWFCDTKHAGLHERTRGTSLALEQAFYGKMKAKWYTNGYLVDASGTPLLDFFHCQSPCAKPPRCGSMFAGHAMPYEPYRFHTPVMSSTVISPAPAAKPVPATPPAPTATDEKDPRP